LKSQLERGPRQVRAAEGLLERLEAALVAAKKSLTQTRVLADERQLQLRQRETRITDLQIKLNACGSNREYQALKEQIAADQQANSVLSDEILEALERIDVLQAEFNKIQSDRNRAASGLETVRTETTENSQRLGSELRRVTDELAKAEQALRPISRLSTNASRGPWRTRTGPSRRRNVRRLLPDADRADHQ